MFSKKEFEILLDILANYDQITTTPHILTEFSNLNKEDYYRKKTV